MAKKIMAAITVVMAGIQFIAVRRTNPTTTMEVDANDATRQILKRSCYNCHSNETVWPWYSHIAPISWLVVDDVTEAREHLNFSEWDKYNPKQQSHKIEEMIEEIKEGEMPLTLYLIMHPGAKMADEDVMVLTKWAESKGVFNVEGEEEQSENHDEDEDED